MPKPISDDKRREIVTHIQAGEDRKDIEKWLFVCQKTITRVWNRFTETGSYEAKAHGGGRKALVSEEQMHMVEGKIKERCDITLHELIDEFDLGISAAALCKRLKKLGMSYKKRLSIQMGESGKTS